LTTGIAARRTAESHNLENNARKLIAAIGE
jgi:hypothetical protein